MAIYPSHPPSSTLHHSNTPFLQYSIAPILHHSARQDSRTRTTTRTSTKLLTAMGGGGFRGNCSRGPFLWVGGHWEGSDRGLSKVETGVATCLCARRQCIDAVRKPDP